MVESHSTLSEGEHIFVDGGNLAPLYSKSFKFQELQ